MSNSTTKGPPRLHVSPTQIPSFEHFKLPCRWVEWLPCRPPSWSTSCSTWWPGRGRRWCPSAPHTQTRFKFKLSKLWLAVGSLYRACAGSNSDQLNFHLMLLSSYLYQAKNWKQIEYQGLVKLHKLCVNSIFKGTSFYEFMDLIDFRRYISLRADHAMR